MSQREREESSAHYALDVLKNMHEKTLKMTLQVDQQGYVIQISEMPGRLQAIGEAIRDWVNGFDPFQETVGHVHIHVNEPCVTTVSETKYDVKKNLWKTRMMSKVEVALLDAGFTISRSRY